MSRLRTTIAVLSCCTAALTAGCVTPATYDYAAFRQSRPLSILVLPPVNDSNAVDASYSVLSQMTLPLAESGYYVVPVTLMDETFRQNGLGNPHDIEMVPVAKLREIFGADAALYVHITQYGTIYQLIASESVVSAKGQLVDLRTGTVLWEGAARASSAEGRSSSGGLVGLLIEALVSQIVESATDKSHQMAAITSARLLSAGRPGGMLYGPRSPKYETQ